MRKTISLVLFAVMIALPKSAFAQIVEIGGIHYYLSSNGTAMVYNDHTAWGCSYHYSGDIVVPSQISYNGSHYTVTSLDSWAFAQNQRNLISVTLPNTIERIGMMAFDRNWALTHIDLPASVSEVWGDAFNQCYSMKEVTIRNSQTEFHGSFTSCSSIEKLNICLTETSPITHGEFTDCRGRLKEINFLEGSTCLETGIFRLFTAYSSNTVIQRVSIPSTITILPDSIFSKCKALSEVSLPNTLTYIGRKAFRGCAIENMTIPNNTIVIGNQAFRECGRLKKVTLPNQLLTIEEGLFADCDSLQSISLPSSLLTIGDSVWLNCRMLNNITIPDNVTTIGTACFEGCESLEQITFGSSLDSIGADPFLGCLKLRDIYMNSDVPPIIASCTFIPQNCTLHVSCRSKRKYMAHPIWGQFDIECDGIIVTMLPISITVNDETLGEAYIRIEEQTYDEIDVEIGTEIELVAVAYPECHFVQWDDGNTENPRVITPLEGHTFVATFEKDTDVLFEFVLADSISDNSVILKWPKVEGADNYILDLYRDENLFVSISFDEEGNLVSDDSNPNIGKAKRVRKSETESSWQYTVIGLQPDTEYTYTFTAKQGEAILYLYSVVFTTPPSTEALENIIDDQNSVILLKDGYIRIIRGNKVYSLTGQEIK